MSTKAGLVEAFSGGVKPSESIEMLSDLIEAASELIKVLPSELENVGLLYFSSMESKNISL
jgi:hypothetical protein